MKYKYAKSRQNVSAIATSKVSKKHKCRKLLNSKNLVAGIITVVGSMMMAAQTDADTVEWDANTNNVWTAGDSDSFNSAVGDGEYADGDDVNFNGNGSGAVALRGALAPGSVTVSSGTYIFTRDAFTASFLTPQVLPDLTTVNSNLAFAVLGGPVTIADLNVQLDIDHTFTGDLEISLTSPDSTKV